MLVSITIVASLLIIGDTIVAVTGMPIPGAVLGMLGLAAICSALPRETAGVSQLFNLIIPFAPMLFVPAAVGIIANVEILASAWLVIILAVTLSTVAALVVTGLLFQFLLRLSHRLVEE